MKTMKDDRKIVEAVKRDETYEIQTSADSILSSYYARETKQPTPSISPKKKKMGWYVGIPLAGAVAAASICLGIFLRPGSSSPVPYTPDFSPVLVRELFSFASFQNGQNDSSSSTLKAKKLSPLSESSDSNPFYQAASTLDGYFDFFSSCYDFTPNNLKVVNEKLEEPYVLKGESYDYVSHYSYGNQESFSFYYGDLSSLEKEDSASFSGVFVQGSASYQTTIQKEVEQEEGETEEEISMEFVNTSFPWDVFVVEKENEVEENEKENAFCLKYYVGLDALTREDPSLSFTYEFEYDEEGAETSFEIGVGGNSFSFEHITYSKNVYTFDIKVELSLLSFEFEDVKLYVKEATRSYVCGSQIFDF